MPATHLLADNLLTDGMLPPLPERGRQGAAAAIAGAGEALLVADFACRHQRNVLFIARAPLDAYHLLEELAFFVPELPVRYLPDWETLPYDAFSPTAENVGRRIGTLAALLDGRPGVTITTAVAATLPCPPPAFIAARAFSLRVGDTLQLSLLQARLQQGGYVRVDRVLTPGEYALYGGQIDIYPPDANLPLRLVLTDDEIEQIRLFNPESQRSVEQVQAFSALPMSECDLSAEGRAHFKTQYEVFFDDDRAAVRRRVQMGEAVAGIEYYLPLFYEQTATVFDYLPPQTAILAHDGLQKPLAAFIHQARLRQKIVSGYENRPTLPVAALFMAEREFFAALQAQPLLMLQAAAEQTRLPPLPVTPQVENAHTHLLEFIARFDGRVVVAVDGDGRAEALMAVLSAAGLQPHRCHNFADCRQQRLSITVAPLRAGFVLPAAKLAVVTETELFQTSLPPRARRTQAAAAPGLAADEIQNGDYVVHGKYGIGRSHGLKNMTVAGEVGEYLEIEYAGTQRLFLPVGQLHQLARHHGAAELSTMGGRSWRRVAKRAERRAHDAAARLLEINARRAAVEVRGSASDELLLAKFIDGFRHAETPDQKRAADEVLADLRCNKPMDRLVAADVGFGKTEVAMRAAAAVAFAGAQTALMAPTTLLAQQHYHTFSERFAGFPAKIALLTRLTSTSERRAVLSALAGGEIDIIIGTHILLGKALAYKNLGLLVIDEEHRFGVNHKEKFKNMRAGVDILSLSATPIPRTLSMALGGMRDLSIISTPPANRLQVKTITAPFSHAVVVEACERELLRGGQVFFIHNEISTLGDMQQQLAKWLPQARIIVAHGSMNGGELAGAMRRFLRRQGEILLCTTIVESGLDIGNANTIVINRADKMGLSRLHQLRGRVGRGNVQAYAYFLRPFAGDIGKQAEARLAAAHDYSVLGGGFYLSMRDLEIRGAGEILGERQSGDIERVGYAMYQRLVNSAARQLAGEADVESDIETTINLAAPALLPAEYIPSPAERMRYYRRLVTCGDEAAVNDIYLEWQDRFGMPPVPAQLLKESHRLRLLMGACRANSLRINKAGEAILTFTAHPPCTEQLMHKITVGECLPMAEDTVKKKLKTEEVMAQAQEIREFLRTLLLDEKS